MKLIKFSLGRGITNMSMMLRTKRSRKPSPVQTIQERLWNVREYLKRNKRATRYNIQKDFGWGDGIIERLHRILVNEYDYEISWNSKKQEYVWVADITQEKLIEEHNREDGKMGIPPFISTNKKGALSG